MTVEKVSITKKQHDKLLSTIEDMKTKDHLKTVLVNTLKSQLRKAQVEVKALTKALKAAKK